MSESKGNSKEKGIDGIIPKLSSLFEKNKKLAEEAREYLNSQNLDLKREAELSSRVIDDFSKKWSIEIMYLISIKGEMGFEEIRKLLDGISSKTLSKRLKTLEEEGFVRREVISDRPPRVKYSLKEKGETLAALSVPIFHFLRKEKDLL